MRNPVPSLSVRYRHQWSATLSFSLMLLASACTDESRANVFATDPDAGEGGTDAGFVFEAGLPCDGDCAGEAGPEGGGGGKAECAVDGDCSDGNACTLDRCDKGQCRHDLLAHPSEAGCSAGQICDSAKGCIPGPVCATTEQCQALLGDDPCKANIACNASTATCEYSILDKDRDGYPPVSCGGGDCDDTNPDIYPGQDEVCDGQDNNCNGLIDEGGICETGCDFASCKTPDYPGFSKCCTMSGTCGYKEAAGYCQQVPSNEIDTCGLSACPASSYSEFRKCCTSDQRCGYKNGPFGFCYDAEEGGGGGSGGGFP